MAIRDRGNHQIDGWKPVMARSSELVLSVDGSPFDLLIDLKSREGEQPSEQFAVVSTAFGEVAGFEEEGQAGRDTAGFEGVGDLFRPGVAQRGVIQPRPSRVVEQQRL